MTGTPPGKPWPNGGPWAWFRKHFKEDLFTDCFGPFGQDLITRRVRWAYDREGCRIPRSQQGEAPVFDRGAWLESKRREQAARAATGDAYIDTLEEHGPWDG